MGDDIDKLAKKQAKADIKRQKKAGNDSTAPQPLAQRLPDGVSVAVQKRGDACDLVVSGLKEEQLKRLLPDITKEVMITVTEEHSYFRAVMMRFLQEGLFQTIIKIIAGLIVGILLIKFGIK